MTISFVSAGTEAYNSSGDITPGLPAGVQTDDILVCVAASQLECDITMGSDWTRIFIGDGGSLSKPTLAVFWHRYAGSSPARAVTFSGGRRNAGICAFRGCKTSGSPFNQVGAASAGTDDSIEHASITTTVDGCLLLCVNGTESDDPRTSLASGFTNLFEVDIAVAR